MKRDFTFSWFARLCEAVLAAGYEPLSIAEYLQEKSSNNIALFRHDVDRNPSNAEKMARIEKEIGIKSTYYFRTVPHVFVPGIIRRISRLGHEIGYHYETLSQARGNMNAGLELFERNLNRLRKIARIRTISMHGRPLSPYDNRDIWKNADFTRWGILGEAYLSLDYKKISYFTDTGRSWNNPRFNIRDKVAGPTPPQLNSTEEMIRYIQTQRPQNICILSHPNRWSAGTTEWMVNLFADLAFNGAKALLQTFRNH